MNERQVEQRANCGICPAAVRKRVILGCARFPKAPEESDLQKIWFVKLISKKKRCSSKCLKNTSSDGLPEIGGGELFRKLGSRLVFLQ